MVLGLSFFLKVGGGGDLFGMGAGWLWMWMGWGTGGGTEKGMGEGERMGFSCIIFRLVHFSRVFFISGEGKGEGGGGLEGHGIGRDAGSFMGQG